MNRIVTAEENYLIQPQNIDASAHLWDSFGNTETEISAGWVIRFLQERGEGWKPFTYAEINAFYERKSKFKGFGFNRLVNAERVLAHPAREFARMAQHGTGPEAALSYAVASVLDPPEIKLMGGEWIVLGPDEKYHLTHQFIVRCYGSRPAQPQAVTA